MKKLLKKMGYIRDSGRIHMEEIIWDITIISIVGGLIWLSVLIGK